MAQQQVPAARRITDPESIDGRLVQSAIFKVGARKFSFRRSLQLIREKCLRFAVHLHECGSHAALRPLRGRTWFWLGNRDAALFFDETQCVRKFAALHLHYKMENVAAFPAAEAIKNLLDRRNRKRRRFFLVERAKPAEILARFLKADVFAHNPNDVGLLLDPLRSAACFSHRIEIRSSKSENRS